MKARAWIIISLLTVIVALPLILRQHDGAADPRTADDTLVVLSPHNASIRQEFGEAFARYWKGKTGRAIYFDWRTPGGGSEIRMVLDAGFKAAADDGREGIGVDLFFGGGEPDFVGQAKLGRFVSLKVFERQPDWFVANGPVPESFTGERYYAADHVWVGTCLSQFGICYNPDFLKRLGIAPPVRWADLGDPAYAGTLVLADPTKSGSVARTFELLVQGEIQRELAEPGADRSTAIANGWDDGLRLIQRMAANARNFTDSASKIPLEVGQGNAAAGMCIDFYGKSFATELTSRNGNPRLVWLAPLNGTTLAADPIAILKGAPHPETAQAFVEFCLTKEGQMLWFGKPGTPGGPVSKALHRLPIRRDVYEPGFLSRSTMPDAAPYQDPGNLIYQPELTGAAFNTLRELVKIMCIDSHEEMTEAWKVMRQAGMPPDALTIFSDLSRVGYAAVGHGDPAFSGKNTLKTAEHAADLGGWFRSNYLKAAEIARHHLAKP